MILLIAVAASFSLKWLLGLSLPLGLILASISAPTDAMAAESITHGLKLPTIVEHHLKNESLFNDASGIILLNMAISWYLSRQLEIAHTVVDFPYSMLRGIIFGLIVSAILVLFRQGLLRRNLKFVQSTFHSTTAILLL